MSADEIISRVRSLMDEPGSQFFSDTEILGAAEAGRILIIQSLVIRKVYDALDRLIVRFEEPSLSNNTFPLPDDALHLLEIRYTPSSAEAGRG